MVSGSLVTHLLLRDAQLLHVYSSREGLVALLKYAAKEKEAFVDLVIDTPTGPQPLTMVLDAILGVGREHSTSELDNQPVTQVMEGIGADEVGDVVIG